MSAGRNRKIFAVIAVAIVAVISGIVVGKLYINMSFVPPIIAGKASDYRDSASDVEALYVRSTKGASADAFNAVELFEIAEYRLNHANAYYRDMNGNVVASAPIIGSINQVQSTQRYFKDGVIVVKKGSPSSNAMAPAVKFRMVYDTNTKKVQLNQSGSFTKKSLPVKFDCDESANEVYDEQDYINKYYVQAGSDVPVIDSLTETTLPYVVSKMTCGPNDYTAVKNNHDGTYSFTINMSGDDLNRAGVVYAREINISANVATFVTWISLTMTVTVDSNYNFKSISYQEVYKMRHNSTGAPSTVTNNFVDNFYFDEASIPAIEEVL